MSRENLTAISSYLQNHSIMTIATKGPSGDVNLDTVDYLWSGDSILFFTDVRTRKASNLSKTPLATVLITDQKTDFFSAQSVEVVGEVSPATDSGDIQKFMADFLKRRPQFAEIPPEAGMHEHMKVYTLKPQTYRMLDNTVAPGHIVTVNA